MDVMVDLETLGTEINSVILTIGAVKFNRADPPRYPAEKKDAFYRRVDIESCKRLGLKIDPATMEWWNNQNASSRDEAFNVNDRRELKAVLEQFSLWLGQCGKIWSHGASFDIPILENAYRLCQLPCPWKYYNVRDTRTIYDLAGLNNKDLPVDRNHHALFDCYRQIWGVNESMRRLFS